MRFKNITLIALFSILFTGALSAQTFFTEDFADLDDWTTVEVVGDGTPSAVWIHTTEGPAGAFATDPMASTTADNGWILFDSDLNCSGEQDSWIISPLIDATDKDLVWLQFESYYRSFNDRPQIRVGSDLNDLASWATVEAFPNATANAYAPIDDANLNPQSIALDLSEFAANSSFYFAFQFLSNGDTANGGNGDGCAYSWQVDDVALTDVSPLPAVDLRITDFFSIAPNATTPGSQVTSFGFVNDIENVGSGTVETSSISVVINDASGEVFNESHDYGSIAPTEAIYDVFFENEFTPGSDANLYQGAYTLTPGGDPDALPDNNVATFDFEISDTLFAKEMGFSTAIVPSADNNFAYGNIFYVPNGNDMYARYMTFGVSDQNGDLAGQSCNIFLYEWDGDTNGDLTVNTSEMTGGGAIAFNSYEFNGTEHATLLTLPIDIDAEAIPLQDNKYYIIAVQYIAQADENMFLLTNDVGYDYRAMNFYTDSMHTVDNTIPEQYGSCLDVGNSGEYGVVGFGWNYAPAVRMSIGNNPNLSGDAIVAINETVLADGSVSVFPNPVNKAANVEFDLQQMSEKVTVEIFDVNGKLVRKAKYNNVQAQTFSIDVADLAVGNYKLRARTDAGIKTVNISVQR